MLKRSSYVKLTHFYLRTYTKKFGQEMVKLLPAFNDSAALPQLVNTYPEDRVIQRLCDLDMGEDDWLDAGLPELLEYLYGAKGLNIPQRWQRCFPPHIFAN